MAELKDSEPQWIVIQLQLREVEKFRCWARRVMGTAERDRCLAEECEKEKRTPTYLTARLDWLR